MFEKESYVIYGSKGLCQIKDIATIDIDGISGNRLYYIMEPVNNPGSTVFNPVDNNKVLMRALISKKDAEELLAKLPEMEELVIPSEKLREQIYKDCVRSGVCSDYLRMIKTLYYRKKSRLAIGKKSTSTDERYLKLVEDALYSEFSHQLEISKTELSSRIRATLDA